MKGGCETWRRGDDDENDIFFYRGVLEGMEGKGREGKGVGV